MNRLGFLLMCGAATQFGPAAWADADARAGADFFQAQQCVTCHSVKGQGANKAPDLGRRFDRDYTPAGIAARMWDHAPIMWAQMNAQSMPLPKVGTEQAANLFAFFYSVRYFEKPGEAERGKRVFEAKHCAECHSITGTSVGPPVDQWASLSDPVVLVHRMWNHADTMKREMATRKIQWPELTSQDLDDLMVYLQNLPQTKGARLEFSLPTSDDGAALFEQKGCAGCHTGSLSLENRLGDSTLNDVAVALWNHAPKMQESHPELSLTEMRAILGYVWARQFFQTRGDAERGHKVFDGKKCAVCHNDPSSDAPALSKPAQPYSSIAMVAVLWQHGPNMLHRMQEKHIAWPQLSPADMVNLIAYLNSR